jgi:hypothetical protein
MRRLILWLLLLTPLAGCDTSAYVQRKSQRYIELKRASAFVGLFRDPTEIPETNFTIRLPQLFKLPFNEQSADPKEPDRAFDPRRLYPPFLQPFPGFKVCYETIDIDPTNNQRVAYYCYVGAKKLTPAEKPTFEAEILDQVKQSYPDAVWAPVEVGTPDGGVLKWKRIVVNGPQPFYYDLVPTPELKNVPGKFQLWLYEAPGSDILLGWRVPDGLAQKIDLEDLATATAGTLVIKPTP